MFDEKIELDKSVKYNYVPEQVFASLGFHGAPAIANLFSFFSEYGYYGEKLNNRGITDRIYVFRKFYIQNTFAIEWNNAID